jgi:hypothetical protein
MRAHWRTETCLLTDIEADRSGGTAAAPATGESART